MSAGWEKYEPSPIEFMHGLLMDKFHEFRKSKTENFSVEINGNDLTNIIASVKNETYEKYKALKLHEPVLKTALVIILLLIFIPVSSFSQLRKDYVYHAAAGSTIACGMYTVGQYSQREMFTFAPELIAMTGGAAKEFIDSMSGGYFSGKDFLITTAFGVIAGRTIRLIWKPRKKEVRYDPYDEIVMIKVSGK